MYKFQIQETIASKRIYIVEEGYEKKECHKQIFLTNTGYPATFHWEDEDLFYFKSMEDAKKVLEKYNSKTESGKDNIVYKFMIEGYGKKRYIVDDNTRHPALRTMYLRVDGKVAKHDYAVDSLYYFDSEEHAQRILSQYLSKQQMQKEKPMNLTVFNSCTGKYEMATEKEYIVVCREGKDNSPLIFTTIADMMNSDFSDTLNELLEKGKVVIERKKLIVI